MKEELIAKLEKETGLEHAQAVMFNSILEDHFILGRKNKEKIVADIEAQLKVEADKAETLYETAMSIIGEGIKDKIKHPFGEQ